MVKKNATNVTNVKGGTKSEPLSQKGQKYQENSDDEEFDGSDDGYDSDALNQNEEDEDDDDDDDDDNSDDDDDDDDEEDEEDGDSEESDEEEDDDFEVQSGESSNSDSDGDGDEDSDDDEDEEDANDANAAEQKAITRKAEACIRHFREANVIKNVIKATSATSTTASGKTSSMNNNKGNSNNSSSNTSVATAPTDLTSLLNTDDVSSDEEDREDQHNTNTIGRVPLHWYDAYDHIGYTINGQKLFKRGISGVEGDGTAGVMKDRIDQAIENRDNPNSLNTVYDMYNDRVVVLSARDLEIISRLQAGTYAHPEHNDMPDYVDYFSSIKEIMPLSARPLAKQSFLPSKWELLKVKKILKGIKNGTYKTIAQREEEKRNANSGLNGTKPPFYMLWKDDEDENENDEHSIANKRNLYHLPAPKMPLPGHAESYNPPPEYLLTTEEQNILEQTDPSDRQYNFIPKQFNSLRHVSGYKNFILERFERCLDLYLCPRKLKLRLNIDPESLVPRLPKPRELKPFPNTLCLQYLGHTKAVKCISISADGQYLVSGSDDCTVRLWEVDTCLCRHIWTFPTPVNQVHWNPSVNHHVIAVATGKSVVFINTGTGDRDSTELSDSLFDAIRTNATTTDGNIEEGDNDNDVNDSDGDEEETKNMKKSKKVQAVWKVLSSPSSSDNTTKKTSTSSSSSSSSQYKYGYPIRPVAELLFPHSVLSVQWHYKGDYLATVQAPEAGATAVCIHQLSKGNTQRPFSKSPGIVQAVKFHPSRPFLFVVTQQHVKIYHLVEQKLMKKLMSGCKWLSSIDVHPSGDHIVLGSYDRRMLWFDLDLSSTPYKTLKYHEKAVRHVAIHRRYPLMVSASDDGSVHVFHSTVYSDLSRSPLIVPLKVLKGHGVTGGVGVLSTAFHPRQPWLFTSGADSVINLFQDI